MFKNNFRLYNWFCILFGLGKPVLLQSGKTFQIPWYSKVLSIVTVSTCIGAAYLSLKKCSKDIHDSLNHISDANGLIVEALIVLTHLFSNQKMYINLYEVIISIHTNLRLSERSLKNFALKLNFWMGVITIIFIILTVIEITLIGSYIFLFATPAFLTVYHLLFHACTMVAVIKVINQKLTIMVNENNDKYFNNETENLVKYLVFDPAIRFIEVNNDGELMNLKFLCKMYDKLSTCCLLLQKCHGKQVLLLVWLMFSNSVIGVTLIIIGAKIDAWYICMKIGVSFSWSLFGGYLADIMCKEVEKTETLVVKLMIDFRCEHSRRETLQVFKQLVETNRLQYSVCNLFNFNFALILNVIMNVVTYSIILIQFFIKTD